MLNMYFHYTVWGGLEYFSEPADLVLNTSAIPNIEDFISKWQECVTRTGCSILIDNKAEYEITPQIYSNI